MDTKNKKNTETVVSEEPLVVPEQETAGKELPDDIEPVDSSSMDSRITVVIPYSASQAQGNELRYALRSWQKNFKVPHKIVIIGEREDWFKDEEVVFIGLEQLSENPQVNTMEALKIAIASEVVSDVFIWTNDDIYIVAPIAFEHIILPKHKGLLNLEAYSGHYQANMENTISLLVANKLPIFNYGTHTPVLYEKEKMVELLEEYPQVSTGNYLFSSVYFNRFVEVRPIKLDWKTDGFLLPVISQSPNTDVFDEMVSRKVFLNNSASGHSPFLEGRLEWLFPEKSMYEK